MARMRTAAPAPDWQHGVILPHTGSFRDHWNANYVDDLTPYWELGDQATAFLHHGEQRYALQVGPDDGDLHGYYKWAWSINRQHGPDIDNPDHWETMDVDHLTNEEGQYGTTKEHAMRGAEEAWHKFVADQNGRRDLSIDGAGGGSRTNPDDDFGDIFGGGR